MSTAVQHRSSADYVMGEVCPDQVGSGSTTTTTITTATTAITTTTTTKAASAKTMSEKRSKTKTGKGNSDHRKEQNRIASRNYRAKRKQKLALLQQILGDPAPATGTGTSQPSAGTSGDALAPPADGAASASASASASAPTASVASSVSAAPLPSLSATAPPASAASFGMPDLNMCLWPTGYSDPIPTLQAQTDSSEPANLLSTANVSTWDMVASYFPSTSTPMSTTADPITAAPAFPSIPSAPLPLSSDFMASDIPPETNFGLWNSIHNEAASLAAMDCSGTSVPMSTPSLSPPSIITTPSVATPTAPVTTAAVTATPATTADTASTTGQSQQRLSQSLPMRPALVRGTTRRARAQRNKPMVRAMLHCVKQLSSHQKRMLLRALLEDTTSENSNKNDNASKDANESVLVEELDDDYSDVALDDDDDDLDDDVNNHDPDDIIITDSSTKDYPQRRFDIVRRQANEKWQKEDAHDKFSYALTRNNLTKSTSVSPTPTMVSMQCSRSMFRSAVFQNCLACGITDAALFFDDNACDGADALQSPFALDLGTAQSILAAGPAAVASRIAAVQNHWAVSATPLDLQPTAAQILVAHHPYLDVLPFRAFRARALALIAHIEASDLQQELLQSTNPYTAPVATAAGVASAVAHAVRNGWLHNSNDAVISTSIDAIAPQFDEDELCYDMSISDGLICWGGISGDASAVSSRQQRDSLAASREMRACVPWDVRSWEPQVWFLKKYWYLVGGWDDEMWRNCRWWHSMRGEDLDYSVFTSPGY